jgi:hypothetical protein
VPGVTSSVLWEPTHWCAARKSDHYGRCDLRKYGDYELCACQCRSCSRLAPPGVRVKRFTINLVAALFSVVAVAVILAVVWFALTGGNTH